jgi:hypothetical protein
VPVVGALMLIWAGCVHEGGEGARIQLVRPTPTPEVVVERFMSLVRRDAMTVAELERLVAVDRLAEGLDLETDPSLSVDQRHAQMLEALRLLLTGDGALRQVLLQGSLMYWEKRRDSRAVVEVTQRLSTGEPFVHEVELEQVDECWKISRFLPHPRDAAYVDPPKEIH